MKDLIFKSVELQELQRKNLSGIYEQTPFILQLANTENFSGERKYLEDLLRSVPVPTQKKWIANLVNQDDIQHLSTWFEIMLYGWLIEAGHVEVEPEIERNYPDFALMAVDPPVVIEARAVLKKDQERRTDAAINTVFDVLVKIELPYLISIKQMIVSTPRALHNLAPKVYTWLNERPNENLIYKDRWNNCLVLQAEKVIDFHHVNCAYIPKGNRINPDYLKPALQEKSKQHIALREKGYPYVIALFLEDQLFSIEEVFNAWIGHRVYTIDIKTLQVVSSWNDLSGVSFHRGKPQKQSVSGILIFNAEWNEEKKSRFLLGTYLENPYAVNKVDWKIFPVNSALVVKKVESDKFLMDWENK